MQLRKVKTKSGISYRYRYYCDGSLKSVTQDCWPFVPVNDTEAEALRKKLEAKYEAAKLEKKESLEWHEKYYSFKNLYEIYSDWRMEKAKNSYKDKLSYFRNYVLHFFLEKKKLENLNTWASYREEFRNWLRSRKKLKGKGKLSTQTMNHIFIEYNCFMRLMHNMDNCEKFLKIELFEKSDDNLKGADDLISLDEYEYVRNRLKGVYRDFYTILYNTGMRVNELYSLSLNDVHRNEIPNEQLRNILKSVFKEDPKCYILLKHQLKDRKNLEFKPLKSRKSISEKNTRYVPIYDDITMKCLAKYVKMQRSIHHENNKPSDKCMLFLDEFNLDKLNMKLKEIYSESKYNYKSAHLTRHAFATNLAGKDLSGVVQKLVLGHNDSTAKRYNHLHESLVRKMANKENSAANDDYWDDIA